MRCCDDTEGRDRIRIVAGMGGVVAVTLFLLVAQLQVETGLLFGA
jgi:hypothetical protein